MGKLTPAQVAWLGEIVTPSGDYPFPPMNTVNALMRRGLVEAVSRPDDVFCKMTGAFVLQATEKGRAALKETLG